MPAAGRARRFRQNRGGNYGSRPSRSVTAMQRRPLGPRTRDRGTNARVDTRTPHDRLGRQGATWHHCRRTPSSVRAVVCGFSPNVSRPEPRRCLTTDSRRFRTMSQERGAGVPGFGDRAGTGDPDGGERGPSPHGLRSVRATVSSAGRQGVDPLAARSPGTSRKSSRGTHLRSRCSGRRCGGGCRTCLRSQTGRPRPW